MAYALAYDDGQSHAAAVIPGLPANTQRAAACGALVNVSDPLVEVTDHRRPDCDRCDTKLRSQGD